MSSIISYSKVIEHERLSERLLDLRAVVNTARKDAPDGVASAALTRAAAMLLADIYRLVSREPGARTLPRLEPSAPPIHRRLAAMLRDAHLALDLFKLAHLDLDEDYGDEWLTLEGIELFREQRKTYPRD